MSCPRIRVLAARGLLRAKPLQKRRDDIHVLSIQGRIRGFRDGAKLRDDVSHGLLHGGKAAD